MVVGSFRHSELNAEMIMASQYREIRISSLLTIFLCLGAWFVAFGLTRQDKSDTLRRAERDTSNLSRIIAEQTERTISGIDTILRVYANEITRHHGSPSSIEATAGVIESTDGILFQISYADASGTLMQTNIKGATTGVNISDREHFIVHRDKIVSGLFISRPVLGRASGKWSIQLSRKIVDRDGAFSGIVVASVDPFYFSNTFNDIDVGTGGLISLVKVDGYLLARINMNESILGKNVSQSPIFVGAAANKNGFMKFDSVIDGRSRLVSYRRLRNYPIYVTTGFDELEFMSECFYRENVYYACALLANLLLVFFWYVITKNVNDLRQTNASLIQSKKQSEAANKAKSEFLANMSHEIRTPMNAVIGLSQLLHNTGLNNRQQNYVTKITASGRHLVSIINDILDYSKIEAGQLTLEAADFVLDSVLENVANLTAMAAAQKGLDIAFLVSPDLPLTLRGDAMRLGQVVINLVNNAVKFTEVGGIVLHISLIERLESAVRISCEVKDTGIGITETQQTKLFRSFSQADTSTTRQYGGTGLGLVLCKRLCELMGGNIFVASQPGLGSTFTFTALLGMSDDRRTVADVASSQFKNLRALVVQSNPTMGESLSGTLTALSFEVRRVNSPLDVLEQLGTAKDAGEAFDLVVLDDQMPDLEGAEAAQIILGDPAFSPAPRIFLTIRFGHTAIAAKATELGIDAVIEKPVGTLRLVDALASSFGCTLALPIVRKAASSAVPNIGLRNARVLLAEDNEINREIALALLSAIGVETDTVENGRLAVERVRADPRRYNAVLMDIQMPEMDGIEACKQIRTFAEAENLPIIAMTAHALDQERDKCLDAGMNDHISKPIDADALANTLIRWIGVERGQGEQQALPMLRAPQEDDLGLPAELPPFQISDALVRMNGDRELLKSLILMFRDRYATAPAEIMRLLDHGEVQELYRLAHTLKGVAGSLEANDAFRAARTLENALKSDPSADVKEKAVALADCIQSALAAANTIQ